jgi:hypothetical protein
LEDGSKITYFEVIKKAVHLHFNTLFKQESHSHHVQEVELVEHIPTVITNTKKNDLNKPIEEEENKREIWSLDPNKAPRIDGFPISFYRFFGDLFKYDLKIMLVYAQKTSNPGGSTNSSFLVLVPKESNPSFNRFCPISLL